MRNPAPAPSLIWLLILFLSSVGAPWASSAIPLTLASPAAASVKTAPPETWVSRPAEPALTPTPDSDKSFGYDYLLLEQQINVREQSIYARMSYRITNSGALQSGARISWEYDPAFCALTVHHIRVIRDGDVQDRLNPATLQTIQQERDYDRHLYDGRLMTFMLLEDVRVGDIIDYAATRKGWNPIFNGKLLYYFPLSLGAPIRHERIRVISPVERVFETRVHGIAPGVKIEKQNQGDEIVSTWENRDCRPVTYEDGTPEWHSQSAYLQLSEYPDWASVVGWAEPLYALPEMLPETLRDKAIELTKDKKNDSAKAVALLEFVQQEIRYLGIELGAGSYRPTPPAEVLARRFGDCKDKTLLYCALMRAAGLTAYPALVSTEMTSALDTRLPSPGVFDHVIAYIPRPNSGDIVDNYFVDPTLTDQQGLLPYRALPDYKRALVISPGTKRLSTIAIPKSATRSIRVEETFTSAGFEKPATLHVMFSYSGLSTDSTRAYIRQNTPEEFAKFYLNEYAAIYPGITAGAPLKWTENTTRNTLTIEADYNIPNLWAHLEGKTSGWEASFYPKLVINCADLPTTNIRTTPLAMGEPLHIEVVSNIKLHTPWTITPSTKEFKSSGFRGTYEQALPNDRLLTTRAVWETISDHVPAVDMPRHIEALTKFRTALGVALTHNGIEPATAGAPSKIPARINWLMVLVTLITVTAFYFVASRLYRVPAIPPSISPSPQDAELTGLGGWLILVGIGVCLNPLRLLAQLGKESLTFFNLDTWEALTLSTSAAYQPAWATVIIVENVLNIIILSISIFLLILFFGKKRLFPIVYITMLAISIVVPLIDSLVLIKLVTVEQTSADNLEFITATTRTIIQAAIWIPYALVSRRVKNTFIN